VSKRPRAITKEADHETKIIVCGFRCYKKSTDVAIASGRSNGKVRSYGKIDSSLDALNNLIKKLQDGDKELRFVYEAGPCGCQIYRHLDVKGTYCSVVAPSMIPRRSGERKYN
jgi:transposase